MPEVQTSVLARYGVTETTIASFRTDSGHYLQISPEFQIKRLLAAGAPSVYQMCPAFRQGEKGHNHNPIMLEWCRLGFDSRELIVEAAELVDFILGGDDYHDCTVGQLLDKEFSLDVHGDSGIGVTQVARDQGLDSVFGRADALDFLIAIALRRLASERVFITEFPVDQSAWRR